MLFLARACTRSCRIWQEVGPAVRVPRVELDFGAARPLSAGWASNGSLGSQSTQPRLLGSDGLVLVEDAAEVVTASEFVGGAPRPATASPLLASRAWRDE
jgi:hypothetical protein